MSGRYPSIFPNNRCFNPETIGTKSLQNINSCDATNEQSSTLTHAIVAGQECTGESGANAHILDSNGISCEATNEVATIPTFEVVTSQELDVEIQADESTSLVYSANNSWESNILNIEYLDDNSWNDNNVLSNTLDTSSSHTLDTFQIPESVVQ